jgi:probable rRNA maturation factor
MSGKAPASKSKLARSLQRGSSSERAPRANLSLSVQYAAHDDSVPTRHQFRQWVRAALEEDAEITLRIVDAEEGQRLNREYRRKDYATNVLTFEYGQALPGMPLLGDIVLCAPVVAKEAKDQGRQLLSHYAHLTVHGVLHMQGHRHETEPEAEEMERREVKILAALGYANPYESTLEG